MSVLSDYSLAAQSPEAQFDTLHGFERNDQITLTLQEKGRISGQISAVGVNGPPDEPTEVYVQFLNYDGRFRDDDKPHHAVTITRDDTGNWTHAKFSYSRSDLGRVRRTPVDEAARIWAGLDPLHKSTPLSRKEAKVVLLAEQDLTTADIADQWGCEELDIAMAISDIQAKHRRAAELVEKIDPEMFDQEATPPWRAFKTRHKHHKTSWTHTNW